MLALLLSEPNRGMMMRSTTKTLDLNVLAKHVMKNGSRMVMIDLRQAVADPAYQRRVDVNHINRILRKWDWKAVRTPTINVRTGTRKMVYIVDGQHTIRALIAKGETHYLCEVYYGLTEKQEAELFYLRNKGPKGITGAAKFKAAVAAGMIVETTILEVVESLGLTILMNGGEVHADFTKTTGVLVKLYNEGGHAHFVRLIKTLALAFRQSRTDKHLQEDAKRNEFIRGLSLFLKANPQWTPEDIRKVINIEQKNAGNIMMEVTTLATNCRRVRSMDRFVNEVLSRYFGQDVSPAMRARAA
jgi:hypothetical protein